MIGVTGVPMASQPQCLTGKWKFQGNTLIKHTFPTMSNEGMTVTLL
jgi:hypothetical protein